MGPYGAALARPGQRSDLTADDGDRVALWLPLLRRLTERFADWAVWKNIDSALTGFGDVDSLAQRASWPAIEALFRDWAAGHALTHVIVCRHIPQGPHLVAIGPHTRHLLQLDVKDRATFRGSTLVDVPRLLEASRVDERGVRRVRPGAEGVIKLVSNGLLRGGYASEEGLSRKRVPSLLALDPDGVDQAAAWFGPAAGALRSLAAAVVVGRWDRRAALTVEGWALLRGVAEPRTAVSRVWFTLYARSRCPVITTIRRDNRRVPDDVERWLEKVRATHPHGVEPC